MNRSDFLKRASSSGAGINPYTGKTPQILNSQICYQLLEEQVCIEKANFVKP